MQGAYLESVSSASLEEMATFWYSHSRLDGAFEEEGIDNSDSECEGLVFGRPVKRDLGS